MLNPNPATANSGAGFNLAQIGLQRVQRQHAYSTWADFPLPLGVPSGQPANSFIFQDLSGLNLDNNSASVYNDVTVQGTITTVTNNTTTIASTPFSLDLEAPRAHNSRIYLSWSDGNYTQARLVADINGNLSNQVTSGNFTAYSGNLALNLSYSRNTRVVNDPNTPAYAQSPSIFIRSGFNELRPVSRGDLAAVCVQFDSVTDAMLSVHAGSFTAYQPSAASAPSLIYGSKIG